MDCQTRARKYYINGLVYTLFIVLFVSVSAAAQQGGHVIKLAPELDEIISVEAVVEKVAGGFRFLEGPVWIENGNYLIFSDIPGNKIYRLDTDSGETSVFLDKSGFTGDDPTGIGREVNEGQAIFYNLGSNGATLDGQGRLVFNAMGDREIVRMEPDGSRTTLASHYQGMRLNSTNDLVYTFDGALYFTDPPSALRGSDNDPGKQMDYNGVFMLRDSTLQLLTKNIFHPNGLAFSPDEKVFYVDDNRTRKVYRFDVNDDGTISNQQDFVDMTGDPTVGNPDGMKVDTLGNLYVAGAGGVWVVSPEGKNLGKIVFPERASNMTFGDADARTLYVTARTGLYRVRVNIPGIRP